MFNDYQTTSALDATEVLFNKALPYVPKKDEASIRNGYDGFIGPWGSKILVKGNEKELKERVLSNLKDTALLPGFHYFTVHVRDQMGLAQVIAWADGDGASVCLWRSQEKLFLCGNYFFN